MDDDTIGLHPGGMETSSGLYINPLDPDPKLITAQDIAHHLSLICRFRGACKWHYSVAQHSIYVSDMLNMMGESTINQLAGILHDAAEAYLGDVIRPIKHLDAAKPLRLAEHRLQAVINKKFGVEDADWKLIKDIDNMVIGAEARQLMPSGGRGWKNLPAPADIKITRLPPDVVESWFLAQLSNLMRRLS